MQRFFVLVGALIPFQTFAAEASATTDVPPTNLLDVARLVLETTKAQTESVYSTINLLMGIGAGIAAILLASAAFFGYREWRDLKRLRATFQERLDEQAEEMRQEINAQIELTSARVEIDTALRESDQATSSRMYRNAIKRIQLQLERSPHLSPIAKVRGLADIGFAMKRLGQTQDALSAIEAALSLVSTDDVARRSLLAYRSGPVRLNSSTQLLSEILGVMPLAFVQTVMLQRTPHLA